MNSNAYPDLPDGEAEWLEQPATESEWQNLAALNERQLLELRSAMGIACDYCHGEALKIAGRRLAALREIASGDTSQLASPEQCRLILIATEALQEEEAKP